MFSISQSSSEIPAGPVAQSVGTWLVSQGSWVRYPVWQHTFVSPSAFSRRAVVSYWQKYVHEVLVNRLGGLSLPRKSVVRLTDRPDMTLDVYRGRKTTMQQQQQQQQQQICLWDITAVCWGKWSNVTLKTPNKNCSRRHFIFFYFYLSRK